MKKSICLMILMLMVSNLAFAASPWTTETTYGNKTIKKLGFGAKNLLLGWTEIVRQPSKHTSSGKAFAQSIGQGLFNTVVYTVGGALHVITFPITNLDVPLPQDGVQL